MSAPTALVIDDSRAMRMVIGGFLRDLGYIVDEAGQGQEALSLLSRGEPRDIVLVDWNMPVMNGLEFIKAVRSDPRYADTRLLVITSETEVGQMVNALSAGADEYLMKPFTDESLCSKLELLGLLAGRV